MKKVLTITLMAILVMVFAFTVAVAAKPPVECSDHVCEIVTTCIDGACTVEKCCWAEVLYHGHCVMDPATYMCSPYLP